MWRRSTIANVETLSDTETWEYDLPRAGVLNGFFMQLRATNGATSNLDNSLAQCVTAVQVRDGGKCLMDVTGDQLQMLSLINSKQPPRSVISEGADDVQTYQALALFGRHLFDNEVGLDLAQLVNPKLRVDFDLTAVRAAGATGFVSGTGRISCVLLLNDGEGAPTPATYVKSAEIKRWTTAASGDEVTQGPLDGPWMRLIARAHLANNNPDAILTDLKVSFDSGRFVALDELTKWAADGLGQFLGALPWLAYTLFRADTDTRDLRSAGIESFSCKTLLDTDDAHLEGFEAGRPTLNVVIAASGLTEGTDGDIYVGVQSHHPYMCMLWDFMGQGMLDVTPYTRGDIVFTQGVASAAASIVLQQMMAQGQG